MFKLIRIGFAAACIQGIIAVTASILIAFAMNDTIIKDEAVFNITAEIMVSHIKILRYVLLLSALGIIFTHGRWTEIATEDVRRASHEANPFAPSRTTESIFGQLMVVTICFAIAVLRPPPYIVEVIVNFNDSEWISSALWSGATSVALVAFGVSAAAAKKVMQEPHTQRWPLP